MHHNTPESTPDNSCSDDEELVNSRSTHPYMNNPNPNPNPGLSLQEIVGRALLILNNCLVPFISNTMQQSRGSDWFQKAVDSLQQPVNPRHQRKYDAIQNVDTTNLLQIIINFPTDFHTLSPIHKALLHELKRFRNDWAHQFNFTDEDTYRTLDTIERLLAAIGYKGESEVVMKTKKRLILQMAKSVENEFAQNINNINQKPDLTTGQIERPVQPQQPQVTITEQALAQHFEELKKIHHILDLQLNELAVLQNNIVLKMGNHPHRQQVQQEMENKLNEFRGIQNQMKVSQSEELTNPMTAQNPAVLQKHFLDLDTIQKQHLQVGQQFQNFMNGL